MLAGTILRGAENTTTPSTEPAATIIANWSFEEGSPDGSFAVDTVRGLAARIYGNPERIRRIPGTDGAGVCFDNRGADTNTGAILLVNDDPSLSRHMEGDPMADAGQGLWSLSITLDIRIDHVGDIARLVSKEDNGIGYSLFLTREGHVWFGVKNAGKHMQRLLSKIPVPADGQWHHVTAVWVGARDSYNIQVRVDGVTSWAKVGIGPLSDTGAPLAIGGRYQDGKIDQLFSGEMDNLQISHNRADLLDSPGAIDTSPAHSRAEHLLAQPGYRLWEFVSDPPLQPECHASTIAQTHDGNLIIAWMGGTAEGHPDQTICASIRDKETLRWSKPFIIADGRLGPMDKRSVFNPVLFQYPDGPLMCFYLLGPLHMGTGLIIYSNDNGRTWSSPHYLTGGYLGATRSKPVRLKNGNLLCPNNAGGNLKFDISSDEGKTWLAFSEVPDPDGIGAFQPTVFQHANGRVQTLGRTQSGHIVTAFSHDNGLTWSRLKKTSLPHNNSAIDATTLHDGRILLVYNHAPLPKGRWGGPRTPLNVAISEDGEHWQAALVLEDQPGEYAYPSVIQADNGQVHITYNWDRVRMVHVEIDPKSLRLTPIVDGQWPGAAQNTHEAYQRE